MYLNKIFTKMNDIYYNPPPPERPPDHIRAGTVRYGQAFVPSG